MNAEDLELDTQKLYTYGAIKLPSYGERYTEIANLVCETVDANEAYMEGGMRGAGFDEWVALRNFFQTRILKETATNLVELGARMEEYAFEVASKDGENADLIAYAQEELSNTTEYKDTEPGDIDPTKIAKDDDPTPPRDATKETKKQEEEDD